MHANAARLNELSGVVIGRAFVVLNTLGAGFLERVYENALAFELRAAGLGVTQQCGIKVRYCGAIVGNYVADILVEQALVVEVKAVRALDESHRLQCTNYLKATDLPLALLLTFGKPRLEIKRVVHRL